ncbi:MAG TPA: DUF3089 domain-containing protein [Caulobacteraceae bacterium]|jgi:hypothetical protein|nr:DUF3089 domain-containing protein [Caulobacteraceae bacterium]
MFRTGIAVLGALALAAAATAQPMGAPGASSMSPQQPAMPASAPPEYPPNDYAKPENWLCWPGRDDACASDLTTTVIAADGSTKVEAFKPDPAAPIDCFYVYPTISRDPDAISDMIPGPEERNVVVQQAARLRAHCRLYAPMYRQFTLAALRRTMSAAASGPRPMVGYDDVRDAWNYYLKHENHGRGVVLVGHSQGSGVLAGLIREQIDGRPEQKLLVSAILMGASIAVPTGGDVGGDFKSIPLCHAATQLGCLITYASFRDTSPPPPNSRFGQPRLNHGPGLEAACTNPAALGGGSGEAHAYFGASIFAETAGAYPWLKGKTIDTPFVSVPGLITAQCAHAGPFHYLAIHLNADPASPRSSDIPGDIVIGGQVLKDWGLHLIDATLFMGDLVDIVGAEGQTWVANHPAR